MPHSKLKRAAGFSLLAEGYGLETWLFGVELLVSVQCGKMQVSCFSFAEA